MSLEWIPNVLLRLAEQAGYVGAVLGFLFLFFFVAAYKGLFPKFTRGASVILALLLFGVIILALVQPTLEKMVLPTQTVDVVLRAEDGSLVRATFTMKYRLADRGIATLEGEDGSAEVRGVPRFHKELDIVDVNAPGWAMRDASPLPIADGKVTVVLKRAGVALPADDLKRPDPSVSTPSEAELEKASAFPADQVTLHYRNLTRKPLTLVMYPYMAAASDKWTLQSRWIDFPISDQWQVYDDFPDGSGWFGMWVREDKDRYSSLGAKNLFFAEEVWLTVQNSEGDDGRPFQLLVETSDPESEK